MKDIWFEGIWGVVVGDALGMPVQFKSRAELKKCPVTTMQGFGTYNMPPGAWSDDSSMTLATLDSIKEKKGIDYDDIMERFIEWNLNGKYTPTKRAFDQGFTCMEAIMNYARCGDYRTCGKTGERANGNGALMRIMPACLYAYEKRKENAWSLEEAVECVHQVSALTHNHLRSKIACGIYFFMVTELIQGTGSLAECLQAGMDAALDFYRKDDEKHAELAHYERMFSLKEFANC
ncbi:MAG: ADP-ribosylglycohydrolase family protein, partial [Lachnospiraceae bacterium]|nr:ADP-ribosylglycohydrolase family protein [Lachnospiraceae bacterium]